MAKGTVRKKVFLAIATLTFVLGLLLFYFGSGNVRFYGGDLLVVIFFYSILSFIVRWRPIAKALSVFLVAFTIETLQALISFPSGALSELTLGSTFDLVDLIFYVFGLVFVFSIDVYFCPAKILR